MNVTLYFDGAAEPNPGLGTYGWILKRRDGKPIVHEKGALKGTRTNNEAEYTALGTALRWLADGKLGEPVNDLLIMGDSQLVIKQLSGNWKCNAEKLQPLRARCLELLKTLNCPWKAVWIGRESNQDADALSRLAYEEATGNSCPGHRKSSAAADDVQRTIDELRAHIKKCELDQRLLVYPETFARSVGPGAISIRVVGLLPASAKRIVYALVDSLFDEDDVEDDEDEDEDEEDEDDEDEDEDSDITELNDG